MKEKKETAVAETPKAKAARLVAKVTFLGGMTKGVFLLLCLLSILGFSFAVTYHDVAGKETTAIIGLVAGIVLLLGAALSAALLSRATALTRKAAEDALHDLYEGEDGLPAEFCLAIRQDTVENLKTILEEQKEEYSPEEYAFIAKVYEERIK